MNGLSYRRQFCILLFIIAALRLVLVFSIGITPQEAYYWNFSRHPAIGYFDHPPVTAWTIRLFTLLLGTNILSIRLGPLIYGFGTMIFVWFLVRRLWNEKTAFLSALAIGVSPIFSTAGFVFTPDPPLVFFWTAGIFFFLQALNENRTAHWIIAGVCGGLAMLSKYTSVFWWLGVLIVLIMTHRGRDAMKTYRPYLMLIAGLVSFSPEIVWNYQNEWASFVYQSSRRAGEIRSLKIGYFFGYVGSQFFALSPILWLGAWWGAVHSTLMLKKLGDLKYVITSAFSFPMMFFFSLVALFYWVKLNWIIPTYVLPLAYFSAHYGGRKIFSAGVGIAVVITVLITIVMIIPVFPVSGEVASTFGWKELADRVDNIRDEFSSEPLIFGPEYKVPSMLAYYLPDKPETTGPQILGLPGLQYKYWCEPDTLAGRDGVCVVDPRWGVSPEDTEIRLRSHFRQVSPPETLVVVRAGKVVTRYYIWRCYGYIP